MTKLLYLIVGVLTVSCVDSGEGGGLVGGPADNWEAGGACHMTLSIDSFAPFASFNGFEGDERSFSSELSASARVRQIIYLSYSRQGTWSVTQNSYCCPTAGWGCRQVAESTSSASIHNGNVVWTSYGAANPCTPPGTPEINVHTRFSASVDLDAQTVRLQGEMKGDNFPNHEMFITGGAANPFLVQFSTSHSRELGPAMGLPGDETWDSAGSLRTFDRTFQMTGDESVCE